MIGAYPNYLLNPAYLVNWLGSGPWTTTAYTAPGWELTRTSTPTVSVRLRTLDNSTSTDKQLRGMPCLHIDVTAITPATQDAMIRQRVSDARRITETPLRLTVPVYGPEGATFSAWFARGTVNAGPTYTTQGIAGGTVVTGTAQAGGASTITLASGASAVNDTFNGDWIEITAGTGLGQMRLVSDYVGATKVLTVDLAWGTQPDATSVYKIAAAPVPTWVDMHEFAPAPSQEYLTVQIFGKPSQTGTFMVGPADLQQVPFGEDRPLQYCELAVEELRLADRYFPVRSGIMGRTSTTSFFPFVRFPVTMRVVPTYRDLVTSGMSLLNDTTGTTVASTAGITNAATDITANGARLALQSGWTGLTNGGFHQLVSPAVIGCFVADY